VNRLKNELVKVEQQQQQQKVMALPTPRRRRVTLILHVKVSSNLLKQHEGGG